MKIEVEGQEILVKDIKYGQKLELLGHYQDVLKPVHEESSNTSESSSSSSSSITS